MDDKLQIVQYLYGEDVDDAEGRRLLEDPALREEYEALRAVKLQLDQRPRSRPDAPVIDRVAAAAGPPGTAPLGKRQDRAARPPRTARRLRLFGVVSTALALVLVVGIGLNQLRDGGPQPAAFEAAAPEADRLGSLGQEAAPPARQDPALAAEAAPAPKNEAGDARAAWREAEEAPLQAAAGARARAEGLRDNDGLLGPVESKAAPPVMAPSSLADAAGGARADTVPAWDEADALMRVHRRIEMLEARSPELTWDDAPALSLDALPPQPAADPNRVEPAGRKRRGNQ